MLRYLLPGALGLLAFRPAPAQTINRVANYYAGQPGTSSYQHFSFWSHEGRRYNMQYSQGRARTDATVRYAGPVPGGFRVRFADGRTLTLKPSGTALLASDGRTYRWEYQGPVNGVGTNCSVCAPDAAAAMQLLRRYYL